MDAKIIKRVKILTLVLNLIAYLVHAIYVASVIMPIILSGRFEFRFYELIIVGLLYISSFAVPTVIMMIYEAIQDIVINSPQKLKTLGFGIFGVLMLMAYFLILGRGLLYGFILLFLISILIIGYKVGGFVSYPVKERSGEAFTAKINTIKWATLIAILLMYVILILYNPTVSRYYWYNYVNLWDFLLRALIGFVTTFALPTAIVFGASAIAIRLKKRKGEALTVGTRSVKRIVLILNVLVYLSFFLAFVTANWKNIDDGFLRFMYEAIEGFVHHIAFPTGIVLVCEAVLSVAIRSTQKIKAIVLGGIGVFLLVVEFVFAPHFYTYTMPSVIVRPLVWISIIISFAVSGFKLGMYLWYPNKPNKTEAEEPAEPELIAEPEAPAEAE